MKPTLERSDPEVARVVDVVDRVVAWHNRHLLAARITAAQVHSVGVVGLPYAVTGARVLPPAVLALPASEAADPATDQAAPAPAEGDTIAIDAVADAAAAPPSILERALREAAAATVAPQVDLPPRPRAWHPLDWWRGWRGQSAFHALFSEDFVAPLRPRQVAAWVALHGVSQCALDADAPRRRIDIDTQRRRPGDEAPEVELHVLTAAIGLGEVRKRVLLAPGEGGAVVGPRHWSRPRVAASASTVGALLALVVGVAAWRPGPASELEQMAVKAAPKAAAAVASAPASAAAEAVSAPAPAASMPVAAPTVAAVVAEPVARPDSVRPRRGRVELQTLAPLLADDERHVLRQAGRALRQEPAAPPAAKAWALVTRPLISKRQSQLVAAQLQAVALLQPLPMRAELLQGSDGWRAVFWPFPTAKDAEKVRLALADKGLRTEVLEF